MRDILPEEVISKIRNHILRGCKQGEEGWESAHKDEDTLTGDLGSRLRIKWRNVYGASTGSWKWRMTYTKFRGRGRGAEEHEIGADGIFQIEVEDKVTGGIENKGLLFQAKKFDSTDRKGLHKQLKDMEKLVPSGSALIEYGPHGYRGFIAIEAMDTKDEVLPTGHNEEDSLGDFLANKFLFCKVGSRGLYYEASRQTLFIPEAHRGYTRLRQRLRHRFNIEVKRVNSSSF